MKLRITPGSQLEGVIELAKKRLEENAKVFTWKAGNAIVAAGLLDDGIEGIEELGFKLEHVSAYAVEKLGPDHIGALVVFRRA